MDRNKLRVLQEVGYRIDPSCALCKHSDLTEQGWGTCKRYSYDHEKHGRKMLMSINATGRCLSGFERLVGGERYFGAFAVFVTPFAELG